ncbi:hypothetical protein [Mycobacterium sp. MS1601]|uniref:hypothetical protein n=1 Tax=Mycobacterium sp. MS1601 TaxID=1936029 RepID=UPI0012F7961A|nr:hypothetical protein [Mycobacterium sp. MS1601]
MPTETDVRDRSGWSIGDDDDSDVAGGDEEEEDERSFRVAFTYDVLVDGNSVELFELTGVEATDEPDRAAG